MQEVMVLMWLIIPATLCLCFDRLGRHGKVFLTVPSQASTDEQKFIQKGEAFGTDSLFDLDPEDTVFFVGGVPADVRVQYYFLTGYDTSLWSEFCGIG